MTSSSIVQIALGFIVVWMAGVVVYALVSARSRKYDPLPAELPEHHDDHAGHGAGASPAHAHAHAHGQPHH